MERHVHDARLRAIVVLCLLPFGAAAKAEYRVTLLADDGYAQSQALDISENGELIVSAERANPRDRGRTSRVLGVWHAERGFRWLGSQPYKHLHLTALNNAGQGVGSILAAENLHVPCLWDPDGGIRLMAREWEGLVQCSRGHPQQQHHLWTLAVTAASARISCTTQAPGQVGRRWASNGGLSPGGRTSTG